MNLPNVGASFTTNVKAWYTSKTVWLAILQATIGFLAAVVLLLQNGLTSETFTALLVGLKGVLDLRYRFLTTQPIK